MFRLHWLTPIAAAMSAAVAREISDKNLPVLRIDTEPVEPAIIKALPSTEPSAAAALPAALDSPLTEIVTAHQASGSGVSGGSFLNPFNPNF